MIRSGSLRMHWGVFISAVLVGLQSVPALAQCRVGETAKLLASDASRNSAFGERVTMSGDKLLIGAFRARGVGQGSGAAYIFGEEQGSWVERIKLTASRPAEYDWFGASVSLDRDLAIIGASQLPNDGPGAVYVFRFDGATWNEEAKLLASDGRARDVFGYSVSVSGDVVIVGAPRAYVADVMWAGAAYIFRHTGGEWTEVQKLTSTDPHESDRFGHQVRIRGNRAVVGAPQWPIRTGEAYVYRDDGNEWMLETRLTGSDSTNGDCFSSGISVDDGRILIGARGDPDGPGSAYVFRHDDETWVEEAKLIASDAVTGARFGISVSLSGDIAVIGAEGADDVARGSGAAYVFRSDGANWNEQYKLTASGLRRRAHFGIAVAIDADAAVVGAYATEEFGWLTGSAYVFDILPVGDDRCDMNCDGRVDSLDIDPFLELLFSSATPCAACVGDVNHDGWVDALDIEPFLNCLFP